MALPDFEQDRALIERCASKQPGAWSSFVDRFLGLVMHVVQHTAQSRSLRLSPEDREDLTAEVFLALIDDDYGVLRRFRGESTLATYLTVVARRVVVRELLKQKSPSPLPAPPAAFGDRPGAEERIQDREEVDRLLEGLNAREAQVVRLYHLDGLSYEEISTHLGLPGNSIGPTLSRARAKMRQAGADGARS